MVLKLIFSQGHARTLTEAVAAWTAQGKPAAELPELLAEIAAVVAGMRESQRCLQAELYAGRLDNPQSAGEQLRDSIAAVLNAAETVYPAASVTDAARLTQEVADLRVCLDDLERNWPWLDAQRLHAGLTDTAAGRTRAVKDILDELQRPDRRVG